jgi:phosphate transport system substrate-binding protein
VRSTLILVLGALLVAACGREPGSRSLTKGTLRFQCDEAVLPAMEAEVAQFGSLYPDATLHMTAAPARSAIADFAADSVEVIVCARAFNKEERDALAAANVEFHEFRAALSAVAVIVHKENPVPHLRTGEADSIFAGAITRWPAPLRGPIDVVIGGVNSSTNEAFRSAILKGKPFTLSATPIDSSGQLVAYVAKTRGAIGIVNVNWLRGADESVRVLALGTPGFQPDSTVPPGQFYTPAQAYVFKEYYPCVTPVYLYSRDTTGDLSLGFISFVCSAAGQKIFLNNGLVPVTMPVRLVQLTSEQIK